MKELKTEILRLKQENEKLKYEIDRQKETIIYLQNYDMCHKTLIQYEQALEEIREISKYNQFYDPRYFMMRGDIGQIQNIKMTEIYERCNKELNEK